MRQENRRWFGKFIWCAVCGAVFAAAGPDTVLAAKDLSVEQAQALGTAQSVQYRQAKSTRELKEIEYQAAVKSVQMKRESSSTVRWSPLVSFTLPEKESQADDYEAAYEPVQIQTEIDAAAHEMETAAYETKETVGTLFSDVYRLQETVSFYEERVSEAQEREKRMRAKVLSGEVSKKDADSAGSSLAEAQTELLGALREFESAKQKLGDAIGLDVSSGYTFSNPCKSAELTRDDLMQMQQTALENNQEYYEAGLTVEEKRIAMDSSYELLSEQFGKEADVLKPYLDTVKNGGTIHQEEFLAVYDEMLAAIDAKWDGETEILSVRIPKEWMKGETDGSRYVEDDPYALCTAILEYQQAVQERQDIGDELMQTIEEQYDAVVAARNSYETLQKTADDSEKQLDAAKLLRKAGELSESDEQSLLDTCEENLLAAQDALVSYTQSLYALDKVSCGGITELMHPVGEETSDSAAEKYVKAQYAEGASYYIRTQVQDQVFVLGVNIPEDFPVEITDFELWSDGTQIGERTAVNKTLRHLTLGTGQSNEVFIRFYNGDTFVSDCAIDPAVYSGELQIVKDYVPAGESETQVLADYSTGTNAAGFGTVTVTAQSGAEDAVYYALLDENGNMLGGGKPVKLGETFTYLPLLGTSLEQLQVQFYDGQKQELYTGYFDTENGVIAEKE